MSNHQICQLAWSHLQAGRVVDAKNLFDDVLKRDARHATALHGLGRIAQLAGQHQAALDLMSQAVQRDAQNAELHFHLGVTQAQLKRLDESLRSMRTAASLAPDVSRYHAVLGTLLEQRGALEEAAARLRRAIELDPSDAPAHVNLSSALLKLGLMDEAQTIAQRALEIDPQLALAYRNLSAAQLECGQVSQAMENCRAALRIDPSDADAHFGLAFALLLTEQYAEGWQEYEWRWETRNDPTPLPQLPGPRWTGDDPAGRRIFVHSEQGLGDSIEFARYLPLLAGKGATVLFRCQPLLTRLMQTLVNVTIVEPGKPLPSYDAHIPLMSLPRFVHATQTVPADVPYLHADPQKVESWRVRIAALPPGRRIGLCWSGNPQQPRDKFRSVDPRMLAPLSDVPNVQWVSLQKPLRGPKPPLELHEFTSEFHDFSEVAALMMNLDLIVSVDTSIAHLAGALARPAWTVLGFLPDFRWLLERSDSPWYPTMRLFRQPARGDWDSVIKMVAAELKALTQA